MSEPVQDEIEQASEAVGQGIADAPAPVDDVVAEERSDLPEVESPAEARAIVEALLFTSNQSLSTRRLAGFLPGWTERQVLREVALEAIHHH